jgi:hypothetical protein
MATDEPPQIQLRPAQTTTTNEISHFLDSKKPAQVFLASHKFITQSHKTPLINLLVYE